MKSNQSDFFKGIFFLALYCIVRFYFSAQLDVISEYASYVFEIGFCLVVWFFTRYSWLGSLKTSWFGFGTFVLAMIAGVAVYQVGLNLNFTVPFDFKDQETLILLLAVGPVIEEFLFRGALFECILSVFRFPILSAVITSALFAFSHGFAYFSVPVDYQSFVLFQAAYTFFLSVFLIIVRTRTDGLVYPIIGHALFNFGFWLSAMLPALNRVGSN
jgi:membrane protease YdiL (CAAX protease family)